MDLSCPGSSSSISYTGECCPEIFSPQASFTLNDMESAHVSTATGQPDNNETEPAEQNTNADYDSLPLTLMLHYSICLYYFKLH